MDIFKDLKVVELASVLAEPSVGTFFAELGAQVTKIENSLTGGDVTRKWKLSSEDQNSSISAYYASANFNKKSILLNLKDEKDRSVVYELVKECDIVVTNYKSGDDKKLGVDYETLKSIKNDLIYGHITGFGDNDERVAYDIVLQAETGFLYMTGYPDQEVAKIPIALIDILAAQQMKQGMLVALLKKEKTGIGAHVKVSLYDSAIAALYNQATNWLMAGHVPQRMGSLHPNISPYGEVFNTKDGKSVVLAVGSDKQFAKLCELLACSEMAMDPDFSNNQQRVANRKALGAKLKERFLLYDLDFIYTHALQNHVPIGRVLNMEEVFMDPRARKLILKDEIEGQPAQRPKTSVFTIG